MEPSVDISAAAVLYMRENVGRSVRVLMLPANGCSQEYSIVACDAASAGDFVFNSDGLTVLVDRHVMLFLDGGFIGYEPGLHGGLKIDDRSEKGGCRGCRSSKPGGCNG